MTTTADSGWTTIAFVNNIHCASCVAYIQDIFSAFGPAIQRVQVNILSHQVVIHHQCILSTSNICRALSAAAFEIDSATTVDPSGVKVQELRCTESTDGWLGAATDRFSLPSQSSPIARLSCLDTPKKNRLEKHVANCAACRKEDSYLEKPAKPRNAHTSRSKSEYTQPNGHEMQKKQKPSRDQTQNISEQSFSPLSSNNEGPDSSSASEDSKEGAKELYTVTLSIGGMTCASCATSVTHALQELSFVKNANVNLMTNSALINYAGPSDLSNKLLEAVEDCGFEASIAQYGSKPEATQMHQTCQSQPHTPRFEAILSISGMTCASCINAIENRVRELSYVENINISLMANSATVVFNDQANLQSIVESIEDIGYDCIEENCKEIENSEKEVPNDINVPNRTVILKIDGMFCKHCPPQIIDTVQSRYSERVVINKPPSLQDPTLTVTYTPSAPTFTIRDIISTISTINESFVTTVFHPPTIEQRSQDMKVQEQRRLLRRLLLSFFVSIPTFLIGVLWMSLVLESDKTRMFFEKPLGSGEATRGEYALFVFATIIMIFAADVFHIRAAKEIRALWRRGSKVPILRRFYRFGSMNLLMSAGTSVAYFSSFALLVMAATSKEESRSHGTTYFDSVVFLTLFILCGRYLEAYSKSKAGNAVAMLGNLRPREAILVVEASSQDRISEESAETKTESFVDLSSANKRIDTNLLEVGDVVMVPHGSSPPADGAILNNSSMFDESSLTGESRPVSKMLGDRAFAGTVNIGDPITMKITDTGNTSMLDQIISVVREGQTRRAPVERVVDSLTGYFVPAITGLAILTFIIWLSLGQSGILPKKYLDKQEGGWAFWSLEFAIAVFVVACPCGIGLAAPTALFVGGGLAAKNGILVRGGGEAFQEASNVDIVVFDKTGTLTEGGNLKVTDHEMLVEGTEAEIAWAVTKSMEESSSHPIARALLEFASTRNSLPVRSASIHEEAGLGLCGTFTFSNPKSGTVITVEAALGSESLISSLDVKSDLLTYFTTNALSLWKSQAKSIALLALRHFPSGTESPNPNPSPWVLASLFAVTDPIRSSALPTVLALKSRGIAVYMLTGDNPTTAAAVATSLSIPLTNVFAGILPTDKAAKIEQLQSSGPCRNSPYSSAILHSFLRSRTNHQKRPRCVAFVGDGINDSPALTAASVSISLASASDIAVSSSHFVLLSSSSSLDSIITLFDLSARVFRRVKFNFAWALAYNVCLVPVAAGVLFWTRPDGWRLGPVWGSAAMAGSSVSVVLSSLALRWDGKRRKSKDR